MYCLHKHSIYFLILSLTNGANSVSTRYTKFMRHILQKAPKAWYSYIQMSPQKILKSVDNHTFQNFVDMNLFQFKRFLRFDFYSKQEAKQHIKNTNFITKGSGRISKISGEELWKRSFKQFEHKWMFKLDKKMALNFTVFAIYFSSSLQDCFRGRLSFGTNRTSQGFQYCGQHSVFSVYPNFVQLHMTLFAKYEAFF